MYYMEQNTPRCRIFWADGKKFKTNICTLFFDMPLRRETVTQVSLIAAVLKEGCKQYPTPKSLAIQGEELFGAIWDVSVVKKGEHQLLLVSLDMAKEVAIEEGIAFMKAILLEPLVEEDSFLAEVVERKKRWLKRHLESMKDDKRQFARKRCLEETSKGCASGICGDGYVEDLPNIDGKSLYAFYQKMVQQATVNVVFVGNESEKQKFLGFRKDFLGMAPLEGLGDGKNFIATAPNFLLERMEVSQSRLVMGFFTKNIAYGEKSYATYLVLNRLLGEGAESLLFGTLREEKNLCYDVSSSVYPLTGLLFVQMGIQEKDTKESVQGVLDAVGKLWKDKLSLARVEEAKATLRQEYEGIADSPWGIANFVADGILMGKEMDLDAFLGEIDCVSREDIRRMARKMRVQTVYLLANKEVMTHE